MSDTPWDISLYKDDLGYFTGEAVGAPAGGSRPFFEVVSETYTHDQFAAGSPGIGPLMTTLEVGDKVLMSTYRVLEAFDDSAAASAFVIPTAGAVEGVSSGTYCGTDPGTTIGLETVNVAVHGLVGLQSYNGPNAIAQQETFTYMCEPDSAPVDVYAVIHGVTWADDGTQGEVRVDLWVWRAP